MRKSITKLFEIFLVVFLFVSVMFVVPVMAPGYAVAVAQEVVIPEYGACNFQAGTGAVSGLDYLNCSGKTSPGTLSDGDTGDTAVDAETETAGDAGDADAGTGDTVEAEAETAGDADVDVDAEAETAVDAEAETAGDADVDVDAEAETAGEADVDAEAETAGDAEAGDTAVDAEAGETVDAEAGDTAGFTIPADCNKLQSEADGFVTFNCSDSENLFFTGCSNVIYDTDGNLIGKGDNPLSDVIRQLSGLQPSCIVTYVSGNIFAADCGNDAEITITYDGDGEVTVTGDVPEPTLADLKLMAAEKQARADQANAAVATIVADAAAAVVAVDEAVVAKASDDAKAAAEEREAAELAYKNAVAKEEEKRKAAEEAQAALDAKNTRVISNPDDGFPILSYSAELLPDAPEVREDGQIAAVLPEGTLANTKVCTVIEKEFIIIRDDGSADYLVLSLCNVPAHRSVNNDG